MIIETIAQTNYHTTTTTDLETAKLLADLHKDTSTLFTITDHKYGITYYEITWKK